MQKKKNIRLLILLVTAIIVTVITYVLVQPKSGISVNKNLFSYDQTVDINKVVFNSNPTVTLEFSRNAWVVNASYDADPQRINVLFAVLSQVSVRREVASNERSKIDSLMKGQGTKVEFYSDANVVKSFYVVGDESRGVTYMSENLETYYLVEIPGYRSYLAGIFLLDVNGWRNPLVFDLNWANLASVQVSYPQNSGNNLFITFDERTLSLEGMPKADSTKLTDLIDDISLMYVNDYLFENEVVDSLTTEISARISVTDIAKNVYTLEVYRQNGNEQYLVRKDSTDFALMEPNLVRRVTKPKSYFRQ
ncbi:hypothetical protein [Fulvivirga lutea]|uniref:DUF4340 domain-containing protein n=1 Tax=Fulvivirga lutea TaxID=2810512 RepID=A0A975A0D3_9BACT|nr:hypothetical protein [Fulvivirga lutea]QSE97075.1 hypothetical protein JR347_15995 [Fulvivirga lutea]